jgi:hypothetical protein
MSCQPTDIVKPLPWMLPCLPHQLEYGFMHNAYPLDSSVETAQSTYSRLSHGNASSTELEVIVPKARPDLTPAAARALLHLIQMLRHGRNNGGRRSIERKHTAGQCIPCSYMASLRRYRHHWLRPPSNLAKS